MALSFVPAHPILTSYSLCTVQFQFQTTELVFVTNLVTADCQQLSAYIRGNEPSQKEHPALSSPVEGLSVVRAVHHLCSLLPNHDKVVELSEAVLWSYEAASCHYWLKRACCYERITKILYWAICQCVNKQLITLSAHVGSLVLRNVLEHVNIVCFYLICVQKSPN